MMTSEKLHIQVLVCILGFTLSLTSRLRTIDIKLITEEHNRHRRDVSNGLYGIHAADMNKLTWNHDLQRRAYESLSCGILENNANHIDYSMNIGSAGQRNYSEIISQWFMEIRFFLPEYGTCVTLSQCRRFMTMANAKHHQIGCAQVGCQNGTTVLLCLYSGAYSLLPVYKTGNVCTKCEGRQSFCDEGLCVSCDQRTDGRCDCRKTCQKPMIGLGHLENTTCTCHCSYGLGPNCDEECKNPEQYEDFDICTEVTQEACLSPDPDERDLLREFCPEKCTCNIEIQAFQCLPMQLEPMALRNNMTGVEFQ